MRPLLGRKVWMDNGFAEERPILSAHLNKDVSIGQNAATEHWLSGRRGRVNLGEQTPNARLGWGHQRRLVPIKGRPFLHAGLVARKAPLLAMLLSGCGGAGNPAAPTSLGNFAVALLIDGSSEVVGSGTLAFTQQGTALGVTGAVLLTNAATGGPATAQEFTEGSLVGGTIRFRAATQAWQFEGTLTDGNRITGRHIRTTGGTTTAGDWRATRNVNGPGPPPPP